MPFRALRHACAFRPGRLFLLAGLLAIAACGRGPAPTLLETPASPGASLPRLSVDPEGLAWMSWVEPEGDGHALRFSAFEDGRWREPRTAAQGRDWFVNWADFPSVVHFGAGRMAAHWLQKVDGGLYAYHVKMAVSTDAGANWSAPLAPHADESPTEHGFVTLFPRPGGVGAAWLDGRNTQPNDHREHDDPAGHDGHPHPDAHQHAHGEGPMTLRAGGLDWHGARLPEIELDPMTCDCCPTAAAETSTGIVVLYRDRTPEEIRDIRAVVQGPEGWSSPALVSDDGWEMPACPVNGPAVAAHGERLAAAWFTAAGGVPRIRLAFSTDGGHRWGPAIEVADGPVVGRVAVVMPDPDSAVVSWLDQSRMRAEIRFRRIGRDGSAGAAYKLATTVAARSSGFPQMALAGDKLLFAWTAVGDPSSLRTAIAPLP
jgi:hypothetical protein